MARETVHAQDGPKPMVHRGNAPGHPSMVRGIGHLARPGFAYSPSMQEGIPVTPDVVDRAVFLDELDLSPDGHTAYVVRRSTAGLAYHTEIWAIPMDGAGPRRLTSGPSDTEPRVSPDGRWLAFLRKIPAQSRGATTGEPRTQVHVLPLESGTTGEARQLTREEHDVSGLAWSPDGSRVAFWGWHGPARFLVGEQGDGKEPTARRITVGGWRWNEVGHLDYRTHLSVIDLAEGAEAVRLTEGDFDVGNPAWDADGRSLVFAAARHPLADLYPRPGIWRVAVPHAGEPPREPAEVLRLRGVAEIPVPSPDGRWLAVVGVDEEGAPDDAAPSVFVARADGSTAAVPIAPALDLPIGAWQDSDLNGWHSSATAGAIWRDTDSGPELIALVTRRGRCDPWRFPVDAATGGPRGEPQPLAEGDAACWQLAVARNGRVAVLGALGSRAMEVMEPAADGGYRTVSTMGSEWQHGLQLPRMELLSVPGPWGPIETWLARPPERSTDRGESVPAGESAPAGKSVPGPLVVDVHGGPLGAWSPAPWLEVQILTSAGFTVALPNVRGSTSYGRDWIRQHLGHWGDVDAADVIAVVDHLVAAGVADPARVGILGLSYGGFLVNWMVGAHPERFAAAVSENGVSNQIGAWANSDSGPDYNRRSHLGEPFDDEGFAALWRQSPLRLASRIRTPLLMLQAEADLRCPPQDNEQLFLVLRALGRTVEYVLYPESSHIYAVTGRPDRRKDRHARMLAWFQRHLE